MNTCDACKHWHLHKDKDELGHCRAITTNSRDRRKAHVSGLYTTLWTRPEFGCVLWNEREPGQDGGKP